MVVNIKNYQALWASPQLTKANRGSGSMLWGIFTAFFSKMRIVRHILVQISA